MDFFLQLVINGISLGCIYALLALGFVIIFKASGVVNFAMGEFMAIGAYICVIMLSKYDLNIGVAALITVSFAILMGMAVERILLRPLMCEPIISVIMVTLGLAAMLRALLIIVFGIEAQVYPQLVPYEPWFEWGDIFVDNTYVVVVILTVLSIISLTYFFKHTRYGNAMRAAANDQVAALSMGMNVGRLFAISWSIMAILAAIGGFMLGSLSGLQIGITQTGLKVFPVVILGGLDSVLGAIVGGIIIGLLETISGIYLNDYFVGGAGEVVPFVFMILILMFRPYGLFGTREIKKV